MALTRGTWHGTFGRAGIKIIEGYLIGRFLGVSRWENSKDGWKIDHIPTGLVVFHGYRLEKITRDNAIRIARELSRRFDWDFSDADSEKVRVQGKAIAEYLRTL